MKIIRLSVIATAISLLILSCNTYSNNSNDEANIENEENNETVIELFPVCNGGHKTHKITKEALHDTACKWGYMNKKGDLVIDYIYNEAYDFHEDIACVKVGDNYGYIDKYGQFIIQPQFIYHNDFKEGFTMVYQNIGDSIIAGIIDKNGCYIIKDNAKLCGFDSFSEGLAEFHHKTKNNGYKSGYIDNNGNVVIEPQFDEAYGFTEGLAVVGYKYSNGYKYGFIDRKGQFVINPIFDDATSFSEGLACVKKSQSVGYIDTTGRMVMELYKVNQLWWPLILWPGKGLFKNNRTFIYKPFDVLTSNPAYRDYRNYCCLIKNDGSIIAKVSDCHMFSEGLAAVEQNDLWGYMDHDGNIIIDYQFSDAEDFNNGLARVTIAGKMAYINNEGTIIWIEK